MKIINIFAFLSLMLIGLPLSAQTVGLRCVGQSVASGVNMPKHTKQVERFYELSPNLIVWHDGTETTTIKRDELPKYSAQNLAEYGNYIFSADHFSFRRYYDSNLIWPIEVYEKFDINRKTGVWQAYKSYNSKYPERQPHSSEINGQCEPWVAKRKF